MMLIDAIRYATNPHPSRELEQAVMVQLGRVRGPTLAALRELASWRIARAAHYEIVRRKSLEA